MHESMLSVVIPVARSNAGFIDLFEAYEEALRQCRRDLEFLFVLDGANPEVRGYLEKLQEAGRPIRVFQLAKHFGEAAALTVGFHHARGDALLTLPDRFQVEPTSLPKLVEALEGNDMVVTRRWPRMDSRFSRIKTEVFNRLVSFRSKVRFSDLGCSARIFRKVVADEIPLYGDQDIFFPLLAMQKGFVVKEIDLPQSGRTPFRRRHASGIYLRRLLDVVTVWFLAKFTRKPLRFFGLIGSGFAVAGLMLLLIVIIERLFFGISLADRPALLLASLMVVLGVQLVSMGLIAELLIFTHARELKEYQVREIVNGQSAPALTNGSQESPARRDSIASGD